jgi:antitoxin component of MazEF toxin-antitoxin module
MPTLTIRKVIKLGKCQLVVSLPTAWVRYNNLKAGDRLEVVANKRLIIRPKNKEGPADTGPRQRE